MRAWDVASSSLATLARAGSGLRVGRLGPRPQQPLVLYEFEACPFCRKVREALTELDLEADIRPCPKGGHRFRDELASRGGKLQFPYLADPNTGKEMYESDDIVAYLYAQYGDGRAPLLLSLGPITDASAAIAGLWRGAGGSRARPSRAPQQPLELWSFESSPFCRLARERLCELELPYRLHNVGKGSPRRAEFVRRSGKMQVPYLADPNTNTEIFESADIVQYLQETYGTD